MMYETLLSKRRHEEIEIACRKCGNRFILTREAIRKATFNVELCFKCRKPKKAAA